jgi:ribosomal protein L4
MSKRKIYLLLFLSFCCGAYISGEIVGYYCTKVAMRSAVESAAYQSIHAIRSLENLKAGNTTEAIRILEKQLNYSAPYLEQKVYELPIEKRDAYHIKILALYSKYKSKHVSNAEQAPVLQQ